MCHVVYFCLVKSRPAPTLHKSQKKVFSQKSTVILCAIVIVILIVIGILGFRDGGWFRSKNRTYDAQYVHSLMDYAEQLERSGNREAAAAVYEQIIKNGGGDLIRKANEEIPVLNADNELDRFKQFLSGSKGGDDQ